MAYAKKNSQPTKILSPTHMTNGQNKFPAPLFVFLRRPKVCIDVSVRYEVWAHAPVRAHVGFFVYFGTTCTFSYMLRVRRTYANFRIHSPRRTAADQITAIEVIISLRVESIWDILRRRLYICVGEREREFLWCVSALCLSIHERVFRLSLWLLDLLLVRRTRDRPLLYTLYAWIFWIVKALQWF